MLPTCYNWKVLRAGHTGSLMGVHLKEKSHFLAKITFEMLEEEGKPWAQGLWVAALAIHLMFVLKIFNQVQIHPFFPL